VASANGRIRLAIRDLDQTVIGNPANDLIRLALSLATAIRGSDLPGATTALVLEEMMAGYAEALQPRGKKTQTAGRASGSCEWYPRTLVPTPVAPPSGRTD